MDTVALTLQPREDRSPAHLRKDNIVPCIMYGNKVENTKLQCDHNELYRVYAKAGESTVVELDLGGKKVPVLFHDISFHPVSDQITHVDFYAVDMNKEIEATIPVHFIGEAPAVKDGGGVLVMAMDHVTVKCLPADLPHSLDVSLESIVDFNTTVTIADLNPPKGVEIQGESDLVLATAQEPRRTLEEEDAEAAEAAEAEGEEGAEGEGEEGGEGAEKADEGSES